MLGDRGGQPPSGRFRVGAAGRAVGSSDAGQVEPGVAGEPFDEALAHGAGRSEEPDGNLRLHLERSIARSGEK